MDHSKSHAPNDHLAHDGTNEPIDRRRRKVLHAASAGVAATLLGAPSIIRAQSSSKIRIGYWPVAAGLPFFAAIEKGYFKEAGSHDLEEAVYLADQVLLLTKRPTRIAEILHYDDPRPRTTATLSAPTFIETRNRSLEIFQREVRR